MILFFSQQASFVCIVKEKTHNQFRLCQHEHQEQEVGHVVRMRGGSAAIVASPMRLETQQSLSNMVAGVALSSLISIVVTVAMLLPRHFKAAR